MESKQLKRLPVGIQTFSNIIEDDMLYIIFSLFGRYVEVEVHTPTGRVDIVMKTAKALYLFELKLNKSAEAAMKQIDLKDYSSKFALTGLPVVKVGINFDPERRTIGDWKVLQ